MSQADHTNTQRSSSKTQLVFYDVFYYHFLLYTLFGSLYLPFPLLKNKRVLRIVSIYCILTCSMATVTFLLLIDIVEFGPYVLVCIEYTVTVYFLSFTKLNIRENVVKNLEAIEEKMGSYETKYIYFKLKKILSICLVWILFFRITYFAYMYVYLESFHVQKLPTILITGFILLASDIQQLPRTFLFLIVKSKVKILKDCVENLYKPSKTFTSQERIKQLNLYHDVYISLMEILENLGDFVNPLYLITIIFTFARIIWLINYMVAFYASGVPIEVCWVMCLEICHWVVPTFMPGIIVELCDKQVDEMCIFIMHQRYNCKDEKEVRVLKEFQKYIQFRPFTYELLWILHMDGRIGFLIMGMIAKAIILVAANRLLKFKKTGGFF